MTWRGHAIRQVYEQTVEQLSELAERGDKYAREAYEEFFFSHGGMSALGAAALFCNERGIPLGAFLAWPMEDQVAMLVAQEEGAMRDALTRFESWKKNKRKQK